MKVTARLVPSGVSEEKAAPCLSLRASGGCWQSLACSLSLTLCLFYHIAFSVSLCVFFLCYKNNLGGFMSHPNSYDLMFSSP